MKKDFLNLIFKKRGLACYEKICSLHQRFSKFFSALAAKQAILFLTHFPESFLLSRSDLLIFRLLIALCRFTKQIEEAPPFQMRIFIRFLDSRYLLRMVVAVARLEKNQSFSKEQILDGVQHLISGVRPEESSYLNFSNGETSFYYLEFRKVRGGFFSREERRKLKLSLNNVLKQKIEKIFKPVILPGIEEDVFKYVGLLANELTHIDDLPQIKVFFSEYLEDQLIYIVIVLRIKLKTSIPFTSLSKHATSSVKICLERSFIADFLSKKRYPKEAGIFKLRINPSICMQDNKVNLRIAHQIITKMLEEAFGEIRDFSGGLIIKEQQQLAEIKEACEQNRISITGLEDLFFEIRPHYMRALITTHTYVHLVFCLNKILSKPIPDDSGYCLDFFASDSVEIVTIKTNRKRLLTQFPYFLVLSGHQQGYTHLVKDEMEYLCIFDQAAHSESPLYERVKECIQELLAAPPFGVKRILRLNLQCGNPISLNPRLASDIHCHTLCTLLFEGLTRIDDLGEPIPAAAERIEISPSGLEYIFHIRSSAWSNGEEVSAYDFERSWKKALMDDVPSFLCPKLFFYLKNGRKVREGVLPLENVGVRALNSKMLRVELESPCRQFLHLVAAPLFFPIYGDGEEPKCFNGRFYLEEWKHNELISLSRNPFSWNSSQLKIQGIRFFMENDPEKICKKFLNRELDMIGDPLSPLSTALLNSDAIQKKQISKQISRIFWIHCNIRSYPLQQKWIRQALNFALNRKKIATKAFYKQLPHTSPLPYTYSQVQFNLEGNPELAQRFFKKGLQELGLKKETFPPLELTHSNLAFEKELADELKKQWNEVLGIRLVTKELPWADFSAALEQGDFQMGGLFRRDLLNHPQYYLNFFQCSSMNPHSLDNAEYERMCHQFDHGQRGSETIREIEKLLIEEAPVFPLVCQNYFGFVQDYLKGFDWSANGCINIDRVYFDEYSETNFSCIDV